MLLKLLGGMFRRGAPAPADAAERDAQLEAGKRAHFAHQHEAAERHYRRALAISPRHPETLFCLGVTCRALGRLDESLRLCHEAYDSEPQRDTWRDSVMHIANDIGKAEGVAQCEAWVAERGDFAAWLGLGNALREAGRLADADGAYARAGELKPASPFVARRHASLCAITGDHETADARFRLSAAAGLWPDDVMHLSDAHFEKLERGRAQLRSGMATPEGGCGEAAGRVVIFVSGDPAYLRRFLHALLNSASRNGGIECLFHVHVVNPDAGTLGEIGRMGETLAVDLHCSWEHPTLPPGDGARTYYACARFLQLPRLLETYRAPLLMLDLDQLVVGGIKGIQSAMAARDLGMVRWHATRWDPWDTYSASAIWYQPTPAAMAFAERTSLYVAEGLASGRPQWFLDQCALFCVRAWMARRGNDVSIEMLDPALLCLAGNAAQCEPPPGTVFWSVTYSLAENHAALEHEIFRRYAQPRGGSEGPPHGNTAST